MKKLDNKKFKEKEITKSILEALDPCEERWFNYLDYYSDFEGSIINFLNLENISIDDKFWVLLRTQFIPENDLHEIGCKYAERVLDNFEKEFNNDQRPRLAIKAKRDYIKGKISLKELNAARSAARSAAAESAVGSAAWSAAGSAAESAESAAAWSATWSAGSAAAGSAARSAESAWSARSAARSAWSTAARSAAAESAVGSAAWSAEQKEQLKILLNYFKNKK